MGDCLICRRIELIKQRANPYFIAELETGYVVAGDHQFFKGYTLFLCKLHIPELHQLKSNFKLKFLEEMSLVAESVFTVFEPKVLNNEALGNSESHLHWHIFPRYADDPKPNGPIWLIDRSLRYADKYKASARELREHKQSIVEELSNRANVKIMNN